MNLTRIAVAGAGYIGQAHMGVAQSSATVKLSAVVDPSRQLLLDVNFTNNSRTVEPRARDAGAKWTLKWLVWLQDALMTWGLFA